MPKFSLRSMRACASTTCSNGSTESTTGRMRRSLGQRAGRARRRRASTGSSPRASRERSAAADDRQRGGAGRREVEPPRALRRAARAGRAAAVAQHRESLRAASVAPTSRGSRRRPPARRLPHRARDRSASSGVEHARQTELRRAAAAWRHGARTRSTRAPAARRELHGRGPDPDAAAWISTSAPASQPGLLEQRVVRGEKGLRHRGGLVPAQRGGTARHEPSCTTTRSA